MTTAIKLTSTDLMNLHGESLAEMKHDRLMKNIAARAADLLTKAGYEAVQSWPGLYQVFGPQGQSYSVTVAREGAWNGCTCPCFAEHKTCKHLQAVLLMLETEAAACASYEALYGNAETAAGCDAYARF